MVNYCVFILILASLPLTYPKYVNDFGPKPESVAKTDPKPESGEGTGQKPELGDGSDLKQRSGEGLGSKQRSGDGSGSKQRSGDGSGPKPGSEDGSGLKPGSGDGSVSKPGSGDGSGPQPGSGDGSGQKTVKPRPGEGTYRGAEDPKQEEYFEPDPDRNVITCMIGNSDSDCFSGSGAARFALKEANKDNCNVRSGSIPACVTQFMWKIYSDEDSENQTYTESDYTEEHYCVMDTFHGIAAINQNAETDCRVTKEESPDMITMMKICACPATFASACNKHYEANFNEPAEAQSLCQDTSLPISRNYARGVAGDESDEESKGSNSKNGNMKLILVAIAIILLLRN